MLGSEALMCRVCALYLPSTLQPLVLTTVKSNYTVALTQRKHVHPALRFEQNHAKDDLPQPRAN